MDRTRKRIDAVLFDVDGTLIDTFHLYLEAYRRALTPFLGRVPADAEFYVRRPASERRFLSGWIGEQNLEACHAEMCRQYAELHTSLCEGVYDGVREMLTALERGGVEVGLVTGKGRRTWTTTSERLGFGEFRVVVTDDDIKHPKPDPVGLLSALDALGVSPGDAVYIGDSATDLEAGRRAGMSVAAALWPKTGPGERDRFVAEIEEHRPDWLFDRPADVTRAFAPWC